MTELQIAMAIALGNCTMIPGSWAKRFARTLASTARANPSCELSERQEWWMSELAYKYRRQMPRHLVPAMRPSECRPVPPPGSHPPPEPFGIELTVPIL